ncbi:hypothetical protein PR202_gb13416 [Eleusine coracana subsp. coracana]|uniref:Uncharacterized protein n=1 Tax=Eleusine coracana subsp. coracana TaxID=191504 RepID=A0AAV5ESL2_ELECO|nr:hypothetical protein QOZ80_9BG0714570 [Eleusine coracana subsp. coracana]GJN25571.1 hypothetical protein PR202_gb13416 [Eleusine coracana subsp. coracana]
MASRSAVRRATPPQSASSIIPDVVEGSHVVKIEGYSRTKGLSKGEHLKSGTFDVGGHIWLLRYYPDGDDSNNAGWISFYLTLHQSSAAKVEARLKFSLLDETGEPVKLYTMVCGTIRTYRPTPDLGWGYGRFIEKKALEESSYLKDDCFRVRCDVVVSKGFRTEASTKFVEVPPPNLHQHLGCLLSSKHGADVTFEVTGETFVAHRNILAARSPVFLAELFGPIKEQTMTSIRVDDIEAKVFSAMLHFIYTDCLPPEVEKSDDTLLMAQHLLVVADRYDIVRLKLICEEMLCSNINSSTVATTLALAEQHGCRGLKAACFEFLKSRNNREATMETDGFDHLMISCPSLIKELLANFAPRP